MTETPEYKLDGFDVLVALASVPALLAFRTWVTLVLWRWFAVPVGAPSLGYGAMMGLVVLATYFTLDATKKAQKYEDATDFYGRAIGAPLFVGVFILSIGFVVRGFTI